LKTVQTRLKLILLTILHLLCEIFVNSIYLFFFIIELPIFIFSDKIFMELLNILRIPGIKLKEKNNVKKY
jgi:hypothetical protein